MRRVSGISGGAGRLPRPASRRRRDGVATGRA